MDHLSTLFSSSLPPEATAALCKSYVTYTLSSLGSGDHGPPVISLLESRNLLAAAGTTGLRTWEAALHLGEYLCSVSPSLVRGRSILELGAGTGYISILCAKHLRASHVMATDGSDDVVNGLAGNFTLNGLQGNSIIHARVFKWGQAFGDEKLPGSNRSEAVDLVLGADVTYDEAAISALVSTFEQIFVKWPNVKIIIAATLRNLKTFAFFHETCRQKAYTIQEVDFSIKTRKLQMGPFYPDTVPIGYVLYQDMSTKVSETSCCLLGVSFSHKQRNKYLGRKAYIIPSSGTLGPRLTAIE
jgi:protein-lysine N-methyltransferase EEF2KMT